jgi:hypothetical protein
MKYKLIDKGGNDFEGMTFETEEAVRRFLVTKFSSDWSKDHETHITAVSLTAILQNYRIAIYDVHPVEYLIEDIDTWLAEFKKTQPRNVDIDIDTFEGSAYYLLAQAKKALAK